MDQRTSPSNSEGNGRPRDQTVPLDATGIDRKLLLIEDSLGDARLIREALNEAAGGPFDVEWVRELSSGLTRLRIGGIGAILTDLFLPDSGGVETVDTLLLCAPNVPILVLSGLEDEEIALQTVKHGAQDFLPKALVDRYTLSRALRHMIYRKTADDVLFAERERAQVTLDSIGDAVLSTDLSSNVTYLNLVAEKMTGWTRKDAVGRPLSEVFCIIDAETRETCRNPLELALLQDRTVGLGANSILIRRDGFEAAIEDSAAIIYDRQRRVAGAVIVFHDVTTARAMTIEMSRLAQHDCLTGLPNRTLLNDRVTQAISLASRHGSKFALLFLDLDHFKHINDSLGHLMGDRLLQSVAKRLQSCVRGSDTLSRQGGDEFVVLLPEIARAKDAALCARKMLTVLKAPHFIGHHGLEVGASIGISIYPDDGLDSETLIKTADTAMYQAKGSGRDNFKFFEQEMNVRAVERQSIEESLRLALDRHQFVLHYQPKVDLRTGEMTGAEALIRWTHPERGMIPPLQFVPIAEDSGLILPIGRWVLREACRQARAWQDAGLQALPIGVNISMVEFRDQDFLDSVRAILRETRLAPRYLELELTESVLMQRAESTASELQALKAMGVQLAVDDFGTGYSSLSYLRRFPIDCLKVDRSFVSEITSNPDDATIVSAVISMGRSLRQRVVAEGVETREQLAFLRAHNCQEGQGYFFSRPVPADQFAQLLRTGLAETIMV